MNHEDFILGRLQADLADDPALLALVARFFQRIGRRAPDVYLWNHPHINALLFRDSHQLALVISTTAIAKLSSNELRALVAQQTATLIMQNSSAALPCFSWIFAMQSMYLSGLRHLQQRHVIGYLFCILGFCQYRAGQAIKKEANRQRYFLADAESLNIVGDCESLLDLLQKCRKSNRKYKNMPLNFTDLELEYLYFNGPSHDVWSPCPSLQNRIWQLEQLDQEHLSKTKSYATVARVNKHNSNDFEIRVPKDQNLMEEEVEDALPQVSMLALMSESPLYLLLGLFLRSDSESPQQQVEILQQYLGEERAEECVELRKNIGDLPTWKRISYVRTIHARMVSLAGEDQAGLHGVLQQLAAANGEGKDDLFFYAVDYLLDLGHRPKIGLKMYRSEAEEQKLRDRILQLFELLVQIRYPNDAANANQAYQFCRQTLGLAYQAWKAHYPWQPVMDEILKDMMYLPTKTKAQVVQVMEELLQADEEYVGPESDLIYLVCYQMRIPLPVRLQSRVG